MEKKTEKPPAIYVAVVGLDNADGKHFKPGQVVTEDDFTPAIFAHWLKGGQITKATVKEETETKDVKH